MCCVAGQTGPGDACSLRSEWREAPAFGCAGLVVVAVASESPTAKVFRLHDALCSLSSGTGTMGERICGDPGKSRLQPEWEAPRHFLLRSCSPESSKVMEVSPEVSVVFEPRSLRQMCDSTELPAEGSDAAHHSGTSTASAQPPRQKLPRRRSAGSRGLR